MKVDLEKKMTEIRQVLTESSKPGEDQTRDVNGSSMSRSGQSNMATPGNKPFQSVSVDMLSGRGSRHTDRLKEDSSMEATRGP